MGRSAPTAEQAHGASRNRGGARRSPPFGGRGTTGFETVAESDSGKLIEEFLALDLPRLFLHGEANRGLSYLPLLRRGGVHVQEIPSSAHFLFHDNPSATFEAIGAFVHRETPT